MSLDPLEGSARSDCMAGIDLVQYFNYQITVLHWFAILGRPSVFEPFLEPNGDALNGVLAICEYDHTLFLWHIVHGS